METKTNNADLTKLLSEYSETCSSLRHYSSLRFAQFSVFFALMAGMITISFELSSGANSRLFIPMRIVALFLAFMFWTFEERWSQMVEHYSKRAGELEKTLGFKTHADRPPVNFLFFKVRFLIITRLLYLGVFFFWLYAIVAL